MVNIGKEKYRVDMFGKDRKYSRLIMPRQANLKDGEFVEYLMLKTPGEYKLKRGDIVVRRRK